MKQDVLVPDCLTSPDPVYGTDVFLTIEFDVITFLPDKRVKVFINDTLYAKQIRKKIFKQKK